MVQYKYPNGVTVHSVGVFIPGMVILCPSKHKNTQTVLVFHARVVPKRGYLSFSRRFYSGDRNFVSPSKHKNTQTVLIFQARVVPKRGYRSFSRRFYSGDGKFVSPSKYKNTHTVLIFPARVPSHSHLAAIAD